VGAAGRSPWSTAQTEEVKAVRHSRRRSNQGRGASGRTRAPAEVSKHQWYGPFDILDRVSANSFKLDIGEAAIGRGTHDVFPVRVLRAYVHDETSPPVKTKSTLSDEEDETEYEIDQILAVRVQRGEYEYLVSWKGYSARLSSSWLDEAGLTPNAAEILAEFKAKVEMPPLPKKRRRR